MKYLVSGYLTATVSVEIEAEHELQARELAEDLSPPMLCHQCNGDVVEGQWTFAGWDDAPDDVVIEARRVS